MHLRWRPMAVEDRLAILNFIAQDNPAAAIELDLLFEAKAELARQNPKLFKVGRVRGTRELVVQPNYVLVYCARAQFVEVVRVLHAAREWPPGAPKRTVP